MHRFLSSIFLFDRGIIGGFFTLGWTVGVPNFSLDVFGSIFHENCRIWIRFRHLFLPGLESVQHVVAQNDGLVLDFCRLTVFSSQHINFPLIDSQLTHIGFQKENIRTLHEWVQDLRRRQVAFQSSHNLTTLLDSSNVESTSNIQHCRPVLIGMLRDFFRRPFELHIRQIHTGSLPDFLQILSDRLNLRQIASHFVIHQSKPIGDPENKGRVGSWCRTLINIHCLENSLSNVHSTTWFKSIVEIKAGRVIGTSSFDSQ
mmetsp:Transcript_89945/g.259233  ORF Transcript_89945/g.259233 Transcript_89945/m.259233 type:complete len:258 (-) Transcript_89945:144-917(-)